MKPLAVKELINVLTENGFVIARQRGSHIIFKHRISGIMVPVPLHGGNKPLPRGTFLAIIKQSKLPRHIFRK